ncbi:MAG TPA: hypothetical protein VGL23_05545 [Chloroflexota bacterium]
MLTLAALGLVLAMVALLARPLVGEGVRSDPRAAPGDPGWPVSATDPSNAGSPLSPASPANPFHPFF